MIFVFDEDNTMMILGDIEEVRKECEGIDVEEGVFLFFNENGYILNSKIISPTKRQKILGKIELIESAKYELCPVGNPNFQNILKQVNNVIGLKTNKHFSSLDEIKQFLKYKVSKI
jgi:hypothetical protein